MNQENFPKSQLLSIKSDNYHGELAIHITSRNRNISKEIIYSRTFDKKLDSYAHYDKNKKQNLTNIILLEKTIVWEIEDKSIEVQLNTRTGEIYDVDS